MKTQAHLSSASLLTIFCLMLAVAPVMASVTLYSNGPYNGEVNGWEIDGNHTVTDSFEVPAGSILTDLRFVYWDASSTDTLSSVFMTLGKTPFADGYFAGLFGATNTPLGTNSFGYHLYQADFGLGNVPWSGSGFLSIYQACGISCGSGTQFYWDENSGIGCSSPGCPSTAYDDYGLGTIPSEAFTISGPGTTPEPSSLVLLGSGVLSLAGLLRRRLMG